MTPNSISLIRAKSWCLPEAEATASFTRNVAGTNLFGRRIFLASAQNLLRHGARSFRGCLNRRRQKKEASTPENFCPVIRSWPRSLVLPVAVAAIQSGATEHQIRLIMSGRRRGVWSANLTRIFCSWPLGQWGALSEMLSMVWVGVSFYLRRSQAGIVADNF